MTLSPAMGVVPNTQNTSYTSIPTCVNRGTGRGAVHKVNPPKVASAWRQEAACWILSKRWVVFSPAEPQQL